MRSNCDHTIGARVSELSDAFKSYKLIGSDLDLSEFPEAAGSAAGAESKETEMLEGIVKAADAKGEDILKAIAERDLALA